MVRHMGMYLNFAFNIFLSTAVLGIIFGGDYWGALGITLFIMACWIGISFSPAGTRLLRMQHNLQDPNEIERSRIAPIFQHVYQEALDKTPSIPKDILWYIHDDDSINAFAVGLHTIGINTGMLTFCQDDEIAAVLAHEFAHIAHRDALATSLSVQSNSLALICKTIIVFIAKAIGVGLSLVFSDFGEDEFMGTVFNLMGKAASWFFDIYISIIFNVCLLFSYASCRQQEYDADQYAAELGFKRPLIHLFGRLPGTPTLSLTVDITKMLYGTHPKTEDRIKRLEAYQENI